jgi:hypothetical protein
MRRAEIIAELPNLSPEDREEIRASLARLERRKTPSSGTDRSRTVAAHIRSPHLADPSQSADFVKQVTELPADTATRYNPPAPVATVSLRRTGGAVSLGAVSFIPQDREGGADSCCRDRVVPTTLRVRR